MATAATAVTAKTGNRNVPLDPGDAVGDPDAGRWQVVGHIADGGFSSVYEVRPATPATEQRYGPAARALKCLWGTTAELTAIGDEAAKMATVEGHPNVLGLVSSFRFRLDGVSDGQYVGLVLELAAEDLPRFAARVNPSERAWAGVFEQVAAGLEHIHSRRVVHGDIKPTNVLRVDGRFAVADFGISAPLESTRSAGIGLARTIAFWPPESASQGVLGPDGVRLPPADGWRATQQGDVWALAVSIHRLLTGRHITPGTTPELQYELVCLGKYSVDDRLGPGWRRLLADCLVREPARRVIRTAAELRARLSELALADQYAGVPWPDGQPRVVAVLDLGRPSRAGHPPIPDAPRPADMSAEPTTKSEPGPARPGPAGASTDERSIDEPSIAEPSTAEPSTAEPSTAGSGAGRRPGRPGARTAEPSAAQRSADPPRAAVPGAARGEAADEAGTAGPSAGKPRGRGEPAADADDAGPGGAAGVAGARPETGELPVPAPRAGSDSRDLEPPGPGGEVLVLYQTAEGGRVQGAVLPDGGLLLAATRHLTDVAVPGLAQQVRDSQRAVSRLVAEQERSAAAAAGRENDDSGPQTVIVDPEDTELTRELSVVVAGVTRQRDELAQDRERLVRHRDELTAERDRLRQQYDQLARRLDRLESERVQRERALVDSPTTVLQAVGRSTAPQPPVRTRPAAARPPAQAQQAPPVRPPRVVAAPRRRRHPVARIVFVLLILFALAASLGVVGAGLATHRDPVTVVHDLVHTVLGEPA